MLQQQQQGLIAVGVVAVVSLLSWQWYAALEVASYLYRSSYFEWGLVFSDFKGI